MPRKVIKNGCIWADLDNFLAQHAEKYKMSFGLEYSCVVDWVADLTPRRNHPKAREYGNVWNASATNRDDAIRKVLALARAEIE